MADETPPLPDPTVESLAATIRAAVTAENLTIPGGQACTVDGCTQPGAAPFCGCRKIAAEMARRIAPLSPPNGNGQPGDRERIIESAVYLAGKGYKPVSAVETVLTIIGKVDHPTAGRPR